MKKPIMKAATGTAGYDTVLAQVAGLIESARHASARSINAIMTATYWEIGRRIVDFEQAGKRRADYGKRLVERLSQDLTARFGRGFAKANLWNMRAFYQAWPLEHILQTLPGESSQTVMIQTPPGESPRQPAQTVPALSSGQGPLPDLTAIVRRFPLPWSAYVRLLSVKNPAARAFYEAEALRGGWSVRQLDRQISTLFYERTALSRHKAAMLKKGAVAAPEDTVTPEQAIKDPYVLEFLNLKDEYSESGIEAALIHRLEDFLLELGGDFTFVGRQRRLRIGDEWYRIDLLFFHRRLRCLVVIDLKLGKFTHADAGQMHLYLNYAREHWTHAGENPPVGLILCAQKDASVAHYALEGLPNKVLAAEYRTTLPDEKTLAEELTRTRRLLEARAHAKAQKGGAP